MSDDIKNWLRPQDVRAACSAADVDHWSRERFYAARHAMLSAVSAWIAIGASDADVREEVDGTVNALGQLMVLGGVDHA